MGPFPTGLPEALYPFPQVVLGLSLASCHCPVSPALGEELIKCVTIPILSPLLCQHSVTATGQVSGNERTTTQAFWCCVDTQTSLLLCVIPVNSYVLWCRHDLLRKAYSFAFLSRVGELLSSHQTCPLITKSFHGKEESWQFLIQWLYNLNIRDIRETISMPRPHFKARNLEDT